tara:strand:- start:4523 stop:4768 length:246 start_codon:yes stop_codon:yes gene_type:complete
MIPFYYLLYIVNNFNSKNILWIVKTSDKLELLLEYANNNSKYEKYLLVERSILLSDKKKELNIKNFKTFVLNKNDIIIKET